MSVLPDVKVLVYAVDRSSSRHGSCIQWLQKQFSGSEPVLFAWNVLIGFVRITTNSKAMANPLSIDEAFDYVDEWLAQPVSRIAVPAISHAEDFRQSCLQAGIGGNLISDAHLAALAIQSQAELCSCDDDFNKFSGLTWHNPVAGITKINP